MIIKACKLLEKFEFKDLKLFSLLSINTALGNAYLIFLKQFKKNKKWQKRET